MSDVAGGVIIGLGVAVAVGGIWLGVRVGSVVAEGVGSGLDVGVGETAVISLSSVSATAVTSVDSGVGCSLAQASNKLKTRRSTNQEFFDTPKF